MKLVATCPCCSSLMLHHFRDRREYWFCRKCWQEMPILTEPRTRTKTKSHKTINLSPKLA